MHRLVAITFLENPLNLPIVNHKDENPLNNCVNNLEWCTQEYNINFGTRTERAAKSLSKKVICIETGKIFNSVSEADDFVNGHNVASVCKGKRETAGGYHWQYYKEEED